MNTDTISPPRPFVAFRHRCPGLPEQARAAVVDRAGRFHVVTTIEQIASCDHSCLTDMATPFCAGCGKKAEDLGG